jgi:hypothetical protein
MTLRSAIRAALRADDAYAETLRHGAPGAAIEAARRARAKAEAAVGAALVGGAS